MTRKQRNLNHYGLHRALSVGVAVAIGGLTLLATPVLAQCEEPLHTWHGDNDGDLFGVSVSGAGDVNGDGFDDLLITGDSLSNNDDGAIYIIYGGDGLNHGGSLTVDTLTNGVAGEGDGTLGYIIEAAEALDAFGYAAEFVGDINGDGLADFIVGARGATAANNGRAYVIFGNEDAPPGAQLDLAAITNGDGSLGFFLDGEVSGDGLGNSVAGAGDVNGDGWPDLIVGAPGYSTDLGRVYVVFGPF
ncbi:MAG: FG-GAP repeat protein [SAR324 cluster bacterium]|nr:FG-GAP repeat protein [SAR324 cluster bacterium]